MVRVAKDASADELAADCPLLAAYSLEVRCWFHISAESAQGGLSTYCEEIIFSWHMQYLEWIFLLLKNKILFC